MVNHRLDPIFVLREIANLRATHPDIWEMGDEELLANTLEGETNLHELLAKLVAILLDADAKIKGIGDLMATLKARCDRFERRSDGMRSLMFRLLQEAGVRKVELPTATLSIRIGQFKVVITDETLLPNEFVRIKREPDRVKIKEHLLAAKHVDGAHLSNREESIAVRVK